MPQFQIKEEGNTKKAFLNTGNWDIEVRKENNSSSKIIIDVEVLQYSSIEISQLISYLEEAQRIATVFEGENNEV